MIETRKVNLTPEDLSTGSYGSLDSVWIRFRNEGRVYTAVYVRHHPNGPHILLSSRDKESGDFADVESRVAAISLGIPENRITDREADICDVIRLSNTPGGETIAAWVVAYGQYFGDVTIPVAYYCTAPESSDVTPDDKPRHQVSGTGRQQPAHRRRRSIKTAPVHPEPTLQDKDFPVSLEWYMGYHFEIGIGTAFEPHFKRMYGLRPDERIMNQWLAAHREAIAADLQDALPLEGLVQEFERGLGIAIEEEHLKTFLRLAAIPYFDVRPNYLLRRRETGEIIQEIADSLPNERKPTNTRLHVRIGQKAVEFFLRGYPDHRSMSGVRYEVLGVGNYLPVIG